MGWWFSPGTPVSYTNTTDRHDITDILLKVALNTIKQRNKLMIINFSYELLFHDIAIFRIQFPNLFNGALHNNKIIVS